MRFYLSTIITLILRKKTKSTRQQSRFSGLTAGILVKPPQYAASTHAHVPPHCTPTNNSFFPLVLLPAQLQPDTTADTVEKCRHSISRTLRSLSLLQACRHRKCVGDGRGGNQMTRVAGKTMQFISLFISSRGVVAWTRGVCARTSRRTAAEPPVLPRGRLRHSWRGRDRPDRPCGLCTSPVRLRPLASQTGPLA